VGAFAQAPLQLSERQNRELVKRIGLKLERFNNSLGKALTKPPLENSNSALEFREYLEDFTLLIGQLTPNLSARRDVNDLLRTASAIERLLLCEDVPSRVVIDWASLHADLDLLARAYGLKWSEAVLTRELVALFAGEVRRFSESLNVEMPGVQIIRTSAANELPELMQQFRQAAQALNADSAKAQHQIAVLSSCTRMLGIYLKDCALGLQLQADWRRLSAQVEELVRIYNLDFGEPKSPEKEMFTRRK
ncbi:MAG TPA: hypothetical protein VKB46_27665, partial [Pyrinomonadaceae bacterium]|nr:hypothetical protein [Pyrinomonadaceae bacterium]